MSLALDSAVRAGSSTHHVIPLNSPLLTLLWPSSVVSLWSLSLPLVVDGGPSMGPVQEPQDMLGGLNFSSKVKEQVQALLTQPPILPEYSSMRKPGFVYLLEGDPNGIISCTHHHIEP